MPRAIEIYVDEKEKAVLINTNYGNREVRGATWDPQIFRLGWDPPEEIDNALRTLSGCEIRRLSLCDVDGPIIDYDMPRHLSMTLQKAISGHGAIA